jgi:hypothetical protein
MIRERPLRDIRGGGKPLGLKSVLAKSEAQRRDGQNPSTMISTHALAQLLSGDWYGILVLYNL